jgi:hypothetical protein
MRQSNRRPVWSNSDRAHGGRPRECVATNASNKQGYERAWLQTTVVPDGVARVTMEFTSPYRVPRTVSLATGSNVGIAVRRFPYTPTIVSWYGANGRRIKKFVDRPLLAYHNCLIAHRKDCESRLA